MKFSLKFNKKHPVANMKLNNETANNTTDRLEE